MQSKNLQTEAYGVFVLRISLGVIFLAHSVYLKMFVFTLPGTAQFFASLGLPAFFAYVVFLAETLGGLALVTGFLARWAALGLVPIALGATWVHLDAGWLFTNTGGGWEYPALLASAAFAQFLLGNGAFALRFEHLRGLVHHEARAAGV